MKSIISKTKVNAGLLIIISALSLNLVKVAWGKSQEQQQPTNEPAGIVGSTLIMSVDHGGRVIDVKFNSQGDRILTIGKETQKLWSLNGEELPASNSNLQAAGFLEKRNQPISTEYVFSEKVLILKILNSEGKELFTLKDVPAYYQKIPISPESDTLHIVKLNLPQESFAIIDNDGTVKMMKFNGLGRHTFKHEANEESFVSNSRIDTIKPKDNKIVSFAFHPQGNIIATISADGTTKLWNTSDGREILSIDDPNLSNKTQYDKHKIRFTSSGDFFTIWNSRGKAQIFNLDGEAVGSLKHSSGADSLSALIFSPLEENIVATSGDRKLKIWQMNGEEIHEFKYTGSKFPNVIINRGIKFSPDGNLVTLDGIVSAFLDDEARLWSVASGEEIDLSQFKEGNSFIEEIIFNPNGKTIATLENDNIVKLWSIR